MIKFKPHQSRYTTHISFYDNEGGQVFDFHQGYFLCRFLLRPEDISSTERLEIAFGDVLDHLFWQEKKHD